MKALDLPAPSVRPALEIDLVADFTCPWSWLARRRLERALGHVQGLGPPQLRWHSFLLNPAAAPAAWRTQLAARLPEAVSIEYAERSLMEAGRELGIRFAFDRLGTAPDTREAHRLVNLAAREGRHMETADGVFAAWFEEGRNIGSRAVLSAVAAEAALTEDTLALFHGSEAGADEVARDDERLRALGVVSVPNLLLNGSVLVAGPADVDTYVQALDHALFPQPEEASVRPPTLH